MKDNRSNKNKNTKRKLLDENGRVFGVISIIDVFVIVVVAVLALAAVVKFTASDAPGSPSASVTLTPVSYDVTFRMMRESAADCLRVGDTVYAEGGYEIGKIIAIERNDAMTISTLADGKQVLAPAYGRLDLTVTIDVDCSVSNGHYYANKIYSLGVNAEIRMYTKYNSGSVIVSRLDSKI